MSKIPPRTATDAYFARSEGRRLDVVFDIDLGELVDGHHVVARGLELGDGGGWLHYEFVPGVREDESDAKGPFFWYWMLSVTDDLDTDYSDDNIGAYHGEGRAAAHGERCLGGAVPSSARRLTVTFTPPHDWTPPGSWCRLDIDLPGGEVSETR